MRYTLAFWLVMGSWCFDDIDWCSLKCGRRTSTMCSREVNASKECGKIKFLMTPRKRKYLLNIHNEYRNRLAEGKKQKLGWPPASNMRQLGWDVILEAVAMRWASHCSGQNDPCPVSPYFWFVGQNVASFSSKGIIPDLNGTKAFKAWTREMRNVREKPEKIISKFNGSSNYGHFTQIIWAETNKVGCAQISYESHDWGGMRIFCDYGIGGNALGEKIYKPGEPCSDCPSGTSCKPHSRYPHLCALPEDPLLPTNIQGPSRSLIEGGRIFGSGACSNIAMSFAVASLACTTTAIQCIHMSCEIDISKIIES